MSYAALTAQRVGDTDDVEALVVAHFALVRRLAWHVRGRTASIAELEELIQSGMVALIEAARDFEDRGFAFSTYASIRIRGAMFDHLRRGSGQSRTAAGARRAINAARRTVENCRPGAASALALAGQMGISVDDYYKLESDAVRGTAVSLDEVYADDDARFCDDRPQPDHALDANERRRTLGIAIRQLDPRSQLVLHLYFFEEMNLEEIGQTLNVGAARVCQIKKEALAKLRAKEDLSGWK